MLRDALRVRLLIELAALMLLAGSVLAWPRPPWVNAALAGLGLLLLLANRGFTRARIWALFPVQAVSPWRPWLVTALCTAGGLALVAGLSAILGRGERLGPLSAGVVAFYAAWALLQQYQFQFYLLGRLLVLLPSTAAVCGTGLAFAAVHYPDWAVMAVTGPAGCCWAALYLRYRLLAPLALSHAVLGAAFFQWVCGLDLPAHWTRLVWPP